MLIGQDVKDFLFQLVGGHMVPVLGGTDQVITHLLLVLPVCGVLGTVRLEEEGGKERRERGEALPRV